MGRKYRWGFRASIAPMSNDHVPTLMTVHAHADDETIGTGGTMAKAVAEGRRVILVTCTRGEMGEIVVPDMDTPDNHRRLGEIRAGELERALDLPTALIGINNRNLRDFSVSLDTTLALKDRVGPGRLLVTESGILAPPDVARMRAAGVEAFLVGEAFMRAPDPGDALRALFG